ncbi:MAG TPA: hypothetical protein VFW33_05610 [Gemmataceae bacterium]|nr:hypothetical protein [Gemmataceae bacterium]
MDLRKAVTIGLAMLIVLVCLFVFCIVPALPIAWKILDQLSA